jgi:hypothetical protein
MEEKKTSLEYFKGYRQGYIDGKTDVNKGSREFCPMCGVDIEHARNMNYTCKVMNCHYDVGKFRRPDYE